MATAVAKKQQAAMDRLDTLTIGGERSLTQRSIQEFRNSYHDTDCAFDDGRFLYNYYHQGVAAQEESSDSESEQDEEGEPGLNRVSWDDFLREVDSEDEKETQKKEEVPSARALRRERRRERIEDLLNRKRPAVKRRKLRFDQEEDQEERDNDFSSAAEAREDWNERYEELRAYAAASGDCFVPPNYNRDLYEWINTQRRLDQANELPRDRKRKLKKLGFVFESHRKRKNEERWNEMYQELTNYAAAAGDCLVPVYSKEFPRLGAWVKSQRACYKKGKMPEDRVQKLEEIGFAWTATTRAIRAAAKAPPKDDDNNQGSGDDDEEEDDSVLEVWDAKETNQESQAPHQDKQVQKQAAQANDEVISVTEDSSEDPADYEDAWNLRFIELESYMESNGNSLVPYEYKHNPFLGIWVAEQRNLYKEGKLRKDREHRLQQVGFVWQVDNTKLKTEPQDDPPPPTQNLDEIWNGMYQKLKDYVDTHGDCLVPSHGKEHRRLSRWVKIQRRLYKKKELKNGRRRKLQKLGFVWRVSEDTKEHNNESREINDNSNQERQEVQRNAKAHHEQSWDLKYEELIEYWAEKGDCVVPQGRHEYQRLGEWVATQRKKNNKGTLREDRKHKLEKLGFAWNAQEANNLWEKRYNELLIYAADHGHIFLPRDMQESGLAKWMSTQRWLRKVHQLRRDRQTKLEELDFDWSASDGARQGAD